MVASGQVGRVSFRFIPPKYDVTMRGQSDGFVMPGQEECRKSADGWGKE